MKNNDELQYMPLMHGKVGYTNDEFKTTNVKNHGTKKGTIRWNYKKFVTTMVLTGTIFGVSIGGGIHAFNTMKGAPHETTITVGEDRLKGANIVDNQELESQYGLTIEPRNSEDIKVSEIQEPETRVTVDYKVKNGDTLDGIIYKYAENANEKDFFKSYVKLYNDIGDILQAGQVITLVGVPAEYAADLNTGYNEAFDKNDEISVQLNEAVDEMLTENGEDYAKGSLIDTVVNELKVFNETTNEKTRSHLAKTMLEQLYQIKEYGNSQYVSKEEQDRQLLIDAISSGKSR